MKRRIVRRWLTVAWGITLPLILLVLLFDPPSHIRDVIFLVPMLIIGGVGTLIADRRPSNPIGWTFIGVLVFSVVSQAQSVGIEFYLDRIGDGSPELITTLAFVHVYFDQVLSVVVWALLLIVPVYYFPTGRLPSPRWRWVTRPVFAALILRPIVGFFRTDLPSTIVQNFQNPLGLPLANSVDSVLGAVVLVGAGIAPLSLVLRFWRSKGIERQQIKWPLYSALIGIIAIIIFLFGSLLVPAFTLNPELLETSALGQFILFLERLYVLSFPITIGIAILRYRLYDIDIIIRRTLQYTLITAILALVYFGTVAVTQPLIRAVTGEQSELAIVISTLAIAALFNPLRTRVQGFIDRRFYRTRYDAQRTLATFAATARDEVELETLSRSLLTAVRKTMKPEQASLWLISREPEPGEVG